METNQTRINHLLIQYRFGNLTRGEAVELAELLKKDSVDAELERLFMEDETFVQEDAPQLKARIFAAVERATAKSIAPVHRIHFMRRAWVRYAAAAVIIAAIGSVWMLTDKKKVDNTVQIAQVVPGRNKAILVTADGKEIALDSNASLQVGSAQIVNGVATYGADVTASMNTLRTPRGGLFEVVLPDGSHVWINSASALTYPTAFTGATRNVTLQGEAYFEVAKDPKHPFIVKAGSDNIEVLGTHFNINSYVEEGAVRTTLAEGSVRVANVILKPGEQYSAGIVSRPDLEEVLAWKNGEFRFKKMSVDQIMRQIARWYDVDVKYESSTGGKVLSGSMPRAEKAETLLEVLNETGVVKLDLQGRTIIVKGQ